MCLLFEGRASGSPTMDLFITLLSLGRAGYRKLLADRKAMYQYLQQQLSLCAERHGQRLLKTTNNPISVGEFRECKLSLQFKRECSKSTDSAARLLVFFLNSSTTPSRATEPKSKFMLANSPENPHKKIGADGSSILKLSCKQ